jgi:hypothetical protein
MLFNHYEAELMMKERTRDALREIEQARLIRAVQDPRESRGWLWLVASPLAALLSTFTKRRNDEPCQYALGKAACSAGHQPAEC